ncbi:uncharacterized protein LOC113795558 [Dermatophagoides pteronyssinus]|uniref:Uncharacterized protein LOC113795558 n=1 Tax=Dermatophagoides pteronyssinus TaxID=6956 RepID=A0A6P6Y831_DERPT|nr:uncharacterized protein LOC113795558 [Dermatophagoides pteronyssinus]
MIKFFPLCLWAIVLIILTLLIWNNVNGQLFRPGQEPQNVINSLLTPILLRSECSAAVDNRMGLCMPKSACLSSGGYVAGTCGYGVLSCCVYQGTCRAVVTSNETYFVSPNYPNLLTGRVDPPVCIFTLQRNPLIIKFPVCQIRIDFDEFSLAPHYNGACGNSITDSFQVSGASNFNQSGLPISGICGEMTGQHIYLDVDPEKTDEPLLLIVNTANQQEYNRKWSIRIRQIPCKSQYRAPPGCLQYYTALNGNIESFNYRTTNLPVVTSTTPGSVQPVETRIANNYLNNLNYGVCIAKHPRICAIRYSAIEFDFGGSLADSSTPGDQCISTTTLASDGDFLTIPLGTDQLKSNLIDRYCGQRFSPTPTAALINADVYSYINPYVIYVHTDNNPIADGNTISNQKGFLLKYMQIPC